MNRGRISANLSLDSLNERGPSGMIRRLGKLFGGGDNAKEKRKEQLYARINTMTEVQEMMKLDVWKKFTNEAKGLQVSTTKKIVEHPEEAQKLAGKLESLNWMVGWADEVIAQGERAQKALEGE